MSELDKFKLAWALLFIGGTSFYLVLGLVALGEYIFNKIRPK